MFRKPSSGTKRALSNFLNKSEIVCGKDNMLLKRVVNQLPRLVKRLLNQVITLPNQLPRLSVSVVKKSPMPPTIELASPATFSLILVRKSTIEEKKPLLSLSPDPLEPPEESSFPVPPPWL